MKPQEIIDTLDTIQTFAESLYEPRPDVSLDREYCLKRITDEISKMRKEMLVPICDEYIPFVPEWFKTSV